MINEKACVCISIIHPMDEAGTDGKDLLVCTGMCSSTHNCGCMVDGSGVW